MFRPLLFVGEKFPAEPGRFLPASPPGTGARNGDGHAAAAGFLDQKLRRRAGNEKFVPVKHGRKGGGVRLPEPVIKPQGGALKRKGETLREVRLINIACPD